MKSLLTKMVLLVALSFALTGCFKSAEDRAAEHLENGLRLVEEGDLPRAIVEFRNTLKYDEDNLEAFRQMGRANFALDQIPTAYASFLRVVEQAPDDVEGRIALSEMAFARQNWEEFDRHSAKLAEITTDLPAAKAVQVGAAYRQAVLDQDTPRRDAVITDAETLARTLPDHLILQRIRIDTYIARGTYEAALTVLNDSIARDPRNLDFYMTKLALLGRLNDQTGLEETLRAMLDIFPNNKTAQETYLGYLLSRDRLQDAGAYLEEHFANAVPDDQNGAFLSLIAFLRETKGEDVALARIDAALSAATQQNQMWQIMRATLIFEMGQRDEGIAGLNAVLSDDQTTMSREETLNAQTALARMLLINGDEAGARQMVEGVLAEDPGLPNALKMHAAWLTSDDDPTAAISDLRIALESDPKDAEAMVLMANAYRRAGNRDLQQNFLARAAESANSAPRYALLLARALIDDDKLLPAESALISSLRNTPENVEILETLGQIYLRLDDFPRTDQVARTLAQIGSEQAQAIAQGLQAELVARRLGVDEALEFLEQQAAQNSDAATATLTIIQARLKTGRIEDALRTAIDAVAENPDDPRLRNALALSYAGARDFTAAAAELETLLDSHPEAIAIYLQLARVNAAQGDLTAGAATIERGLAVLPDAPDLLWAKASYLESNGDIAGAIAIYETLYTQNSESAVIANNLASLLVSYREDPESLARAQTIGSRLNGTDIPAFQDTYGYIQFRRGNMQEALAYLEPAAEGLANDPNVQFHLGEVYAALDRPDESLNQMRRALEIIGPLGDPAFRTELVTQIAQIEASLIKE